MAKNNQLKKAEQTGLRTITNEILLREYSVDKVIRNCRHINTTIAAIDSGFPSLALLKRNIGEDSVQAYIEMWIINLLCFVNIGKSMSDTQVFETSSFIIYEYSSMNISDVNLVFKMGKMGKFGKIYDRIDGQIIISWFEEYFKSRCSDAANRSINEAQQHKGGNVESFAEIAKKHNLTK